MKKHETPSKPTGYTRFTGAESTTPSLESPKGGASSSKNTRGTVIVHSPPGNTTPQSQSKSTPPQEASKVFEGGIMDPLIKYIDENAEGSLQVRAALLQTCSLFRQYFDPSLVFAQVRQQALLRLVVFSEQKRAETLLSEAANNPERLQLLLFGRSPDPVENPWGKPFRGMTAFQIALCEGNFRMAEMLAGYFQQIPGGLQAMHRQMLEVFPDGFPESEQIDPPHFMTQADEAEGFTANFFRPCVHAFLAASHDDVNQMLVEKSDPNSQLGQAVANFRAAITAESFRPNAIHNNHYLIVATNVYHHLFHPHNSTEAQRQLFCVQVIGFVQRLSAMIHSEVFRLRYSSPPAGALPIPLQDLAQNPTSGLGFDYWVGVVEERSIGRRHLVRCSSAPSAANEMFEMGRSVWCNLELERVHRLRLLFNRCRPSPPEPVASSSAVTP